MAPEYYVVGLDPFYIQLADLDGDGDDDVITANHGGANTTILENDGNGAFTLTGSYGVGLSPYCVCLADLDGDADRDMVTANNIGNTVSILVNGSFIPYVQISGFTFDGCSGASLGDVFVEFIRDDIVYYHTTSASNGLYELADVAWGKYDVRYSISGYQTLLLSKHADEPWTILSPAKLYTDGHVSSISLKNALSSYCNAYRQYMLSMASRTIDMNDRLRGELYSSEYVPARKFTESIWERFQLLSANTALSLITLDVEAMEKEGFYSFSQGPNAMAAVNIAEDIFFTYLECKVIDGYKDIYTFLKDKTITGEELRQMKTIIIKDNSPVVSQTVYSIEELMTHFDNYDMSNSIGGCIPAGFPIKEVAEKLEEMTARLKGITFEELSNIPHDYYNESWIIPGNSELTTNCMHSFGVFNKKFEGLDEALRDFGFWNTFGRKINSGCQLFGLGSTSYKTVKLVKYGLNEPPAAWGAAGKYIFYAGLFCDLSTYASGFYSVTKEAGLAEAVTDFNLFWPDYFGRSFSYYREINESIIDLISSVEQLSSSKNFASPVLDFPDQICFAIDEYYRTINGTISIENKDAQKPGELIVVGNVFVPYLNTYECISQFRSDLVSVAPGSVSAVSVAFNIPTPTLYMLFSECWLDIDIITSSQVINLRKKMDLGVIPNCPNRPPYRKLGNIISGSIGEGESIVGEYIAGAGAVSVEFAMNYGGSDLDLHVYNSAGDHIGKNYNTGGIEIEIPGAAYSGDSIYHEIISVPTAPGETYQVVAYGYDLADSELVIVQALETSTAEPELVVNPAELSVSVTASDTAIYIGYLHDYSRQHILIIDSVIVNQPVDSLGGSFPVDFITVEMSPLVEVDSIANFTVKITADDSIADGIYVDSLNFCASSGAISVPLSVIVFTPESTYVAVEDEGENAIVPFKFGLEQNNPNPFNSATMIEYDVPLRIQVTIEVLNVLGQKVRTLVNETKSAGTHRVEWEGKNDRGQAVASGIYFYRLKAGDLVETKKMVLLK